MSLRFHEISEQHHRILNPFTESQLQLLGEICHRRTPMHHLDLCCGKGEMLCQWSAQYGHTGVGVDLSPVFLKAAQQRALELHCNDRLTFVEADAGKYAFPTETFNLVSCIGATWIGNGLLGTLNLLRPGLADQNSLMLVGEPYWIDSPPDQAYACVGNDRELFTTLAGTLERIESAGLELVEMILADHHGWDRYVVKQWMTISDWLRQHPDDPEASEIRQLYERSRREYLTYLRRYLGWGVFVLRPR